MSDSQRQGIGGVGGTGRFGKPKYFGDHLGHRRLVRRTIAGDGRFNLGWRVQDDRDPPAGSRSDHDPGCLGRAHHRADVELAEDAFDGDNLGLVRVEPFVRGLGYREQPQVQSLGRLRPGHADGYQAGMPVRFDVDHSEPAPRQTWIDSEHPQHGN